MQALNTSNMERYIKTKKCVFLSDYEEYSSIMKTFYKGAFIEPSILVLGKTGTEKSSLCKVMAGLPPDTEDADEGFRTSLETSSCTSDTSVKDCCFLEIQEGL